MRRRILALDGEPGAWLTSGFDVVAQAPGSFDERLAAGWVAAGGPGIHIGTDTPPVTAGLLELIDRQCWATRAQARRAIVEYIEAFYNRRRLHSSLQYLTPAEYELKIQPPQGRSRGIVRAPGEPGQPQWVRCCAWRRRCEGGGNASPNWRRHGSQCY